MGERDSPICAACGVVYGAWKLGIINTNGEADSYLDSLLSECRRISGYPDLGRPFLDWFDISGRDFMLRELAAEVRYCLENGWYQQI